MAVDVSEAAAEMAAWPVRVSVIVLPPEEGFILDVLLADMIADGLIEVTADKRLQATEKGLARLLIADTYSVQRAMSGAEVIGWTDPAA